MDYVFVRPKQNMSARILSKDIKDAFGVDSKIWIDSETVKVWLPTFIEESLLNDVVVNHDYVVVKEIPNKDLIDDLNISWSTLSAAQKNELMKKALLRVL